MKYTMMIVALVCATACVGPEAYRKLQGENNALKAHIANLAEQHKVLASRAGQLENENQELGARAVDAAYLKEQEEKVADLLKRYGTGSPTKIDGVELVPTSEGYAFRVAGGVLFASGQNALSDGGKRTLSELVKSLQGRAIRVEGHTDDAPIIKSRWQTNLRLSVERSMSVADFLIAAGLSAEAVSVAGYGEHRRAVAETTDAARKVNRRVEILLLER